MRTNPFINQRREQEDYYSEVYINQQDDFPSWISSKNYLFEGLRGSGKTSILNLFNYPLAWLKRDSIIPNSALKPYFEKDPSYIGVIYKSERQEKSNWQEWAIKNDIKSAQHLYIAYLNYYFLDKFIEAISLLRESFSHLNNDSDDEIQLVNEILVKTFPIKKLRPKVLDYSLSSLKNEMAEIHNLIRDSLILMEPFESIKSNIFIPEGSELIQEACKAIKKNISAFSDKLFFALIDDVNRLSEWQLNCINSLISKSEDPLSFKISCVFGLYHTKRTIDGRVLGDRDLLKFELNTDEDFTKIMTIPYLDDTLEAIFNIRIKNSFPELDRKIQLTDLFGNEYSIDEIILNLSKTSENPSFRGFVTTYEGLKKNRTYKYITDFWLDSNNVQNISLKDLELKLNDPKLISRKRDSQFYKKRRVTTIFSIIDFYNLGKCFPYHSFNIIKHITCGSVSEFLRICEKLWPEIENFVELSLANKNPDPISIDDQSKAIKSVSDRVFKGIDEKTLLDNDNNISCQLICDRLSKLFTKFISINSIRKTTECLSLRVTGKLPNIMEEILEEIVLFEAIIKLPDGDSIKIGLHPILSPHYNLPFRSPFHYSETISVALFQKLFLGNEKEANAVIQRIYKQRDSDDRVQQNDLFSQQKDVE